MWCLCHFFLCIHLKDSPASRITKHVDPRLNPRHSSTSLHATPITHNPSVFTHYPEQQYLHPPQQQPSPPPPLQRPTRGLPGNHMTPLPRHVKPHTIDYRRTHTWSECLTWQLSILSAVNVKSSQVAFIVLSAMQGDSVHCEMRPWCYI